MRTIISILLLVVGTLPLAAQNPSASQAVDEMIALCKLRNQAVSAEFMIWDGEICYEGITGRMEFTAHNAPRGSRELPTLNVPYNSASGGSLATSCWEPKDVKFPSGVSLGWATRRPLALGGISITLPDGNRKNYLLPVNMSVTTLTSARKPRYRLIGKDANGALIMIDLTAAQIEM